MKKTMVEKQIEALKALEGKNVEAGWFESARYPNGKSVAEVARQNEFGTKIDVAPHSVTIYKTIDSRSGEFKKNGRFTRKSESNYAEDHMTKAYSIVIPSRPFMRNAYAEFLRTKTDLQKRLGKQLFSGKITADQVLGQIGLYLEQCITESIKKGNFQDNAASTIKKKGFNRPLVESSHMLQSVASKVN